MMGRAIAVLSTLILFMAFGAQAQAPIAEPAAEAQGRPPGIAYLSLNLKTNRPIETIRPDQLDTPIAPGSVMKIATLAAALESGVITPQTGILCDRDVTIAGHRLICTHPDLHRPLLPAEALAYSCNTFFATVSARLSRSAFDGTATRLGLPPSNPAFPLAAAALGLEGVQATPRRLLEMIARVAADPTHLSWRPATLSVVRTGLRGAAQFGTAAALAAHGVDAMAKTGTVITPTGPRGLVVGVTPPATPATGFVLLASGGAGMDAAALAAERLAQRPTADTSALRIGVTRTSGGYAVQPIPLEEYVAGVLAGEAAPNSSPAALEALAITIRTYAITNRGRHAADGFDVCDLTHCQVLRKPTPATTRAAAATAGRILTFRAAPASVYYSASCGGHTERPSEVWPGAIDPPFLPSRIEDVGAGEPEPAWTADLSAVDLARALRASGFRGDILRDLTIVGRNDSHRVVRLRLGGFVPSEISGPDFRTIVGRTLGWQYIKSTAFDLSRNGRGFHFVGHGSGHGVGLCVMESARRAALGQSAAAILDRYFPGTTISSVWGPTGYEAVTVSLPEGDQEERAVLQDLAIRARNALAKQLGVAPPAQLSLRFYPTVESYQRATGKPWFTAGASLGTQMHFIPLTILRQRGILERTIRHELVHVLTEQTLADRPVWAREGAALYFAGQQQRDATVRTGNQPRGPCPTDGELLKPSSPEGLGLAYDRAAVCFSDQLRAGKTWNEIAR